MGAMRNFIVFGAVVLVQSIIATPFSGVEAQARFQLSPVLGMYIPHGRALVEQPHASPFVRKHPVGGPVFTVRLNAFFTQHGGLEAALSYSPALIAVRDTAGRVADLRSSMMLGSMKGMYRIAADSAESVMFQFGGGFGFIRRGGEAWLDTPAHPAVAVVLSAGLRTRLDFNKPVIFHVDLEDFVSWPEFKSTRPLPSRLYNDVILSFGIAIPISGSRAKE